MNRLTGFIFILVSAMSFGSMAIFGKYAYREGMDPISVLFFRFSIASVIMIIIMLIRGKKIPSGRNLGILIFMGLLGYTGQSYSYFTALSLIPAGLVAMLLYLYPVFVTALSFVFLKETVTPMKIIALFLAIGGAGLVVDVQTGGALSGVFWGTMAAVIYSIYILAGTTVMKEEDSFASSTVIIAAAAVAYGIFVSGRGLVVPASPLCWGAVIAIAVICTITAIATFFAGLKRIGPIDASLLSTFEPVTTVALASILLGERIVWIQILGMILILTAAFLLTHSPKTRRVA